jgi:dipeptidyl aminopeptidase/acylaminoacyl peptidase
MLKPFRLVILAVLVIIVTAVAMDLGLAWMYVFAVTHPGCPTPQPIPGIKAPEEHWLKTEDSKNLRVWYYPSRNGAAILAMGGMTGSLGSQLPPVGFLIQHGYGVLQVDSRACAIPPELVTLGLYEVYDATAGLAFLQSRPEVDPGRIGAFGFSMGSAAIVRMAAHYPGIAAVLNEGGYFNLGRDFVEPDDPVNIFKQLFLYTIAYLFWWEVGTNPWESSPLDDIASINPYPLLLIYGEHELMSGRGEQQYQAAGQPKELWVVPGGAHGTNYWVAKEEYERRVLDFFDNAFGK